MRILSNMCVFQQDIKYDKIDELVKEATEFFATDVKQSKNPRPHMNIKTEDLDPFWLDFVKKNKLGTKISGVRFHGMRPGSESEDPHLHAKARGVFYIQAPEGVGDLTIPDQNEIIKPHRGLFVVVPAVERHGMTENKSNDIRIIMAFYIE